MMDEVSVSSSEEMVNPLLSSSINSCVSSGILLSALRLRDHQTMDKKRILKNLFILCSGFFIFFLGFTSLGNLQTTMNVANNLGLESQALLFAVSMVSSLFLPELMIRTVGCKRTVVIMIFASVPFLASNFKPVANVILPTSFLMGLAIGPLYTAGAFYTNEMALRYLRVSTTPETLESVLARFCGLLSFFMENTQIWGNLVSYYIITPGMAPLKNSTASHCGIDFRLDDGNSSNPNLQPPTDDQRYILVSVYVLVAVIAAVLVGLFLDKLENDVKPIEGESKCSFIVSRLLGALRHASRLDQIVLLPITVFCGMEIGFYTADFTRLDDSGGLFSVYVLVAVIAAVLVGLFLYELENDVKPIDGESKCAFIVSRLLGALRLLLP
ncbi:hypothetical protein JTE90_013427 [Oedothorax gibbosus]|uniref:UNC93-like protein n=1 Tax=Oedothorax gibbosus TaxID=931172 RepID=A0AAV6UGM2_9ARAC|nr:hypothetical protein JTE90_013427 [Oedothorax gibbosus]